jgi:hypothetical protein
MPEIQLLADEEAKELPPKNRSLAALNCIKERSLTRGLNTVAQQDSSMGNDTLFRVVVLVLGTIPVALVAAAVLISPP